MTGVGPSIESVVSDYEASGVTDDQEARDEARSCRCPAPHHRAGAVVNLPSLVADQNGATLVSCAPPSC
jgi:hypothetical protein